MKKNILIIVLTCLNIVIVSGQNLLLIGAKSYPCTESFEFKSNIEHGRKLTVVFAKDGISGIISVTVKGDSDTKIKGNLIIYLEDATVLTCIDKGKYDHVDGKATTLYSLTKKEIELLKSSNILTVRFTLYRKRMDYRSDNENYSVSNKDEGKNKKIDVPSIIKTLFD